MSAQQELEKILSRRNKSAHDEQTTYRELQKLREEVKSRKKTMGSAFENFVFVHVGSLDKNIRGNIDTIHNSLKGAVGQPIVAQIQIAIQEERKSTGCFHPGPLSYQCDFVRLGVLASAHQWDMKEGLILPMEHHAWYMAEKLNSRRTRWQVLTTPIRFGTDEISALLLETYPSVLYETSTFKKRDDIPDELHKLIAGRNSFGHSKYSISATLKLHSGDDSRNFFTKQTYYDESAKAPPKLRNGTFLYEEGLQCVRTGMSVVDFAKHEEQVRQKEQCNILKEIYTAYVKGDVPKELLQRATACNLYKEKVIIEPQPGITVTSTEFLPPLGT